MRIKPEHHVPAFPRPSRRNTRQPALLDWRQRTLTWPDGSWLFVKDWPALRGAIIEHNLIVYAEGSIDLLFWPAHQSGDRLCYQKARPDTPKGTLTAIQILEGRKRFWIVPLDTWGGATFTQLLELFTLCKVGPRPTPASLSLEVAHRLLWPQARKSGQWQRRPPWRAWWDFHENVLGGRAEVFVEPDKVFKESWEKDQHGAYGFPLNHVPGGRCIRLRYPDSYEQYGCRTAFVRATWEPGPRYDAHGPNPLGIRLRDETRAGYHIAHPRTGKHEGWYFVEELAEAQRLGIEVEVLEGWGFTEMYDVWSVWVEFMDKLRRHPRLSKIGKLMTVALVGRLLCGRDEWEILADVPENPQEADCLTVMAECEPNEFYPNGLRPRNLWAVSKLNLQERGEALIHVGMWALRMAWLRGLWPEVLAAAGRGDLIAYDTDALYTEHRPPGRKGKRMGTWGYLKLEEAKYPALRWMIAKNKVKTPGMPAPRGALTPR